MAVTHKPLTTVKRVLIANRGEIAVRCIRACKLLGVKSYSIYTKSDAASLHVKLADESLLLHGDGTAGYLDIDDIIRLCVHHNIDTVLPGYGFLSENADFAKRIGDAGIVFAGPSTDSLLDMGLKHRAREVACLTNVPVVPGTGLLSTEAEALDSADRLGYPIMLKATGGGGGMGLQICHDPQQVSAALQLVRNRGEKLFKNSGALLEKYYPRSRHVEVQVFGNGTEVVHFGERECSIQRRHQKVIEECPSPFVEARPGLRQKLTTCAVKYAAELDYKSAGTVEFLVDNDSGDFFFLEMNTRLQVEHGITELCYGVDLVVLMLRQADHERAGERGIPSDELRSYQSDSPNGAAIEARLYAEDPYHQFAPSPGIFQEVRWPEKDGIRIDTWIQSGQDVGLHYDPLIAKAMVHAPTRDAAIVKMSGLCTSEISLKGPTTNLDFVRAIIDSNDFAQGHTLTDFLDKRFTYKPCGIDVQAAGSFSTIQDFPGRPNVGHGVPKSGPMDNISARVANLLVGNKAGTEVIECTLLGPTLRFTAPAVLSVCGADALVTVDGNERPMWSTISITEGQTLKVGSVTDAGCRVYIAVHGGFPSIPYVFGSKSTSPSLHFGGCQGRTIRNGDFLQLASDRDFSVSEYALPTDLIPSMKITEVFVMQGPHDSADIMTDQDRDMLYTTKWKVGHNSSRTGIRMIGPEPQWARETGGEAGSHPSNYLDYGYPSPGGINWGGDSPVIFAADSPNFGGLICSSTVISADLWKLGQLKPGDEFVITPVTLEEGRKLLRHVNEYISQVDKIIHAQGESGVKRTWQLPRCNVEPSAAILKVVEPAEGNALRPNVTYRQGGDRFILVEFGRGSIKVSILAHIHLFLKKLQEQRHITIQITPHVSSVSIEYDPLEISQKDMLHLLRTLESSLETSVDLKIPCREWCLPLVVDHPDMQSCVKRYMETVRDKAVYLPDNLEYLAKNNGLASKREVFDMILQTDYLVSAVGFLCGAPVLFPLNPKAIIGQKYNPTRVSTPGGTFGLGGSLLSGYTFEQPGGYMLLARTLEMWDSYGVKPGFSADKPWMFEVFDKIKFFEVSIEEYDKLSKVFASGAYDWHVAESTFNVREAYDMFEESRTHPGVIEYQKRQKLAIAEQDQVERSLYASWKTENAVQSENNDVPDGNVLDPSTFGGITVSSPIPANVWKVMVEVGDTLQDSQVVAVLEAMKMEVNVYAPGGSGGAKVHSIIKPGTFVGAGEMVLIAKVA